MLNARQNEISHHQLFVPYFYFSTSIIGKSLVITQNARLNCIKCKNHFTYLQSQYMMVPEKVECDYDEETYFNNTCFLRTINETQKKINSITYIHPHVQIDNLIVCRIWQYLKKSFVTVFSCLFYSDQTNDYSEKAGRNTIQNFSRSSQHFH